MNSTRRVKSPAVNSATSGITPSFLRNQGSAGNEVSARGSATLRRISWHRTRTESNASVVAHRMPTPQHAEGRGRLMPLESSPHHREGPSGSNCRTAAPRNTRGRPSPVHGEIESLAVMAVLGTAWPCRVCAQRRWPQFSPFGSHSVC